MPLAELFREFKRAALAAGADDVSYLVGTAGPEGYNDIIAPPDERPLATGDVLMLDTGCVWDGYFCDFDRNFAIASASAAAQEAHRKLYDAIEAAMPVARPGRSASELFTAMDKVLRDGPGRRRCRALRAWPRDPADRTAFPHGMGPYAASHQYGDHAGAVDQLQHIGWAAADDGGRGEPDHHGEWPGIPDTARATRTSCDRKSNYLIRMPSSTSASLDRPQSAMVRSSSLCRI